MKILCVSLDPPTPGELVRLRREVEGHEVSVLVFSPASEGFDALEQAIGRWIRRRLDARDLMPEALPVARDRFVQFCADWPRRPLRDGKGFKELFQHEGLSLWWLCELSQKDTEARPTFVHLCQVEVLRQVLSRSRYDQAVLLTRDPDLEAVFTQACELLRTSVVRLHHRSGRPREGLGKLLLGRIKDWCLAVLGAVAASFVMARVTSQSPRVASCGLDRQVVFYTWYPVQWATWRGAYRDRYYVHVPDVVDSQPGWKATYLCAVPSTRFGVLMRNWRAVAVQLSSAEAGCFECVERFASVGEVCRVYAAIGTLLRYCRLERHPDFRASFLYHGVNIFPIVKHDLRLSFIRQLPQHLLQMRRIRRFIQRSRPAWLVTMLETYCSGRAIVWGVRSSGVGTKVAGYQLSPINANQLTYHYRPEELANGAGGGEEARGGMPIPDLFLLHGRDAQRMLEVSGVPSTRLRVCGSPRFDELLAYREQRRTEQPALRQALGVPPALRLVVVAGDIRPAVTGGLLRLCMAATTGRSDLMFLFKPHPLHQQLEWSLERAMRATRHPRWMCSNEPLNRIQAAADVMVTANSTSDVEAIVIGCPVIRVMVSGVDASPTIEMEGLTLKVASAHELASAFARVVSQEEGIVGCPEFEERIFYRLDGRAAERMLEAFREMGCQPSLS